MRTDHIWHQISEQTGLHTDQSCFKHFAEFAKFLLLIPHCNSCRESIFNTIRKTCSDGCHY